MADHKVEITHPADQRETVTPMTLNDSQLAAARSDETNLITAGGSTPDVEVTIHTSANPPQDN
jgi:hypothetical protein